MDGDRVPGAQAGTRRRRAKKARGPVGLQVKARDGIWYLSGTVRAAGKSSRVRKSTGLEATAAFQQDAEQIRRDIEREIVDQLVHGIKPSVTTAIAVDQYGQRGKLSPRTLEALVEIEAKFGQRKMTSIAVAEWTGFVDQRHARNKPETRERYLNAILPFLRWCLKKEWHRAMPEFERKKEARKPTHRRARRVAELTPGLIMLLLESAAPHLAVQLAVEWSTGARVSSVLYGCRVCDLALERLQITFHDTKNGDPVVASLHPAVVPLFERYLKWRGGLEQREALLFLTNRREPYERVEGAGGQNKTAFLAARRRAVAALRKAAAEANEAGDTDRWLELEGMADLLATVTQHWFRHKLATDMMAIDGNTRQVMEQGGWRDFRSVLAYTHDVPESRKSTVAALPIAIDLGSILTQTAKPPKQVIDK